MHLMKIDLISVRQSLALCPVRNTVKSWLSSARSGQSLGHKSTGRWGWVAVTSGLCWYLVNHKVRLFVYLATAWRVNSPYSNSPHLSSSFLASFKRNPPLLGDCSLFRFPCAAEWWLWAKRYCTPETNNLSCLSLSLLGISVNVGLGRSSWISVFLEALIWAGGGKVLM